MFLHEQPTGVGYWGWLLYVLGMLMVLVGLAYIADASVSPTIVAAVTDDTGGRSSQREGEAWPAQPHNNFDGISPGDRPDVDHRRASISRASLRSFCAFFICMYKGESRAMPMMS